MSQSRRQTSLQTNPSLQKSKSVPKNSSFSGNEDRKPRSKSLKEKIPSSSNEKPKKKKVVAKQKEKGPISIQKDKCSETSEKIGETRRQYIKFNLKALSQNQHLKMFIIGDKSDDTRFICIARQNKGIKDFGGQFDYIPRHLETINHLKSGGEDIYDEIQNAIRAFRDYRNKKKVQYFLALAGRGLTRWEA